MNETLLTMSDVARLARVQRPVVSMWRKRPTAQGQHMPFPDPVAGTRNVRFHPDEIVDWLTETRRGNNPDVAHDIVRSRVSDLVIGGHGATLESLVLLRKLTDEPLSAHAIGDLVDLADECDPDDVCLFREVQSSTQHLLDLASTVDRLCEAMYGAGPAFGLLSSAASESGLTPSPLTPAAVQLVQSVLWDGVLGTRTAVTLAGLVQTPDLVWPLLSSPPEGVTGSVKLDDVTNRTLLRAMRVAGVEPATSPNSPVIHVTNLVGAEPQVLLDNLDDVQLLLSPGDVALIVGPSAVLTDDLSTNDLEQHRDHLLRLGSVRHVIRLPAGLNPLAPRQHLALWVIAPHGRATPMADRKVLMSDLSNEPANDELTRALAIDVAIGLNRPKALASHAFGQAKVVSLPELLARGGALVRPGTRPDRGIEATASLIPAEDVLTTAAVLAHLNEPQPSRVSSLRVSAQTAVMTKAGEAAVEDLIAANAITVHAGARVDPNGLARGTVRLLTAECILEPDKALGPRVDPIDLEQRHPRARRTEAGDIAFVTSPRPAALVCRDGGSVVTFPARVLRVKEEGLMPEAVAATINALPPNARQWRGWVLPRADPSQAQAFSDALRAIEDERAELVARNNHLDELAHLLIRGASRGTLALTIEGDD